MRGEMDSEFPELRFRIENLGPVRAGEFTHKPLTVFCGTNNTGKTWTMYSLYHFHRQLAQADARTTPDQLNALITAQLPRLFNAPSAQLKGATFALVNAPELPAARETFLLPAERSGLQLLFRELRPTAAHREPPYAKPVAHYIQWLNRLPEMPPPKAGHPQPSIAGGQYHVDPGTGAIAFTPHGDTPPLGQHLTSGAVKNLFGLSFYLERQARPGNILMIDEPELNLHPAEQRSIVRLLARLVNTGIAVTISTHSDYIVREFNSLLMLSQYQNGNLSQKHRYDKAEILRPEQVGAYRFYGGAIQPLAITPQDGIHAITFDEVIAELNRVNDDIHHQLKERYRD